MPRPSINLEPHKAEICRLRQSNVPFDDIVHLLAQKHGIKVTARTLKSRFSLWGVTRKNLTATKDTALHARIRVLMYDDGLDDQGILAALQREGFDINARTLKYVRLRLGYLRTTQPPTEQPPERDTATESIAPSDKHIGSPDAAQNISSDTNPAPEVDGLPTLVEIEAWRNYCRHLASLRETL